MGHDHPRVGRRSTGAHLRSHNQNHHHHRRASVPDRNWSSSTVQDDTAPPTYPASTSTGGSTPARTGRPSIVSLTAVDASDSEDPPDYTLATSLLALQNSVRIMLCKLNYTLICMLHRGLVRAIM